MQSHVFRSSHLAAQSEEWQVRRQGCSLSGRWNKSQGIPRLEYLKLWPCRASCGWKTPSICVLLLHSVKKIHFMQVQKAVFPSLWCWFRAFLITAASKKVISIFETFAHLYNFVAFSQDYWVSGTCSCKHIDCFKIQTKQIITGRSQVNLNNALGCMWYVTHEIIHMTFLFPFRLCQGISQEKALFYPSMANEEDDPIIQEVKVHCGNSDCTWEFLIIFISTIPSVPALLKQGVLNITGCLITSGWHCTKIYVVWAKCVAHGIFYYSE